MFEVPSAFVNIELLKREVNKDLEGRMTGWELQSSRSHLLSNGHEVGGTMPRALLLLSHLIFQQSEMEMLLLC